MSRQNSPASRLPIAASVVVGSGTVVVVSNEVDDGAAVDGDIVVGSADVVVATVVEVVEERVGCVAPVTSDPVEHPAIVATTATPTHIRRMELISPHHQSLTDTDPCTWQNPDISSS